jgi:Methyltransferase domain
MLANQYSMWNVLKARTLGSWAILKRVAPVGTPMRRYSEGRGMEWFVTTELTPIVNLAENGDIWMSDDPYLETPTCGPAIEGAYGKVLECGLGIGQFTYHTSSHVPSITVVERNQHVIDLVWPQLEPHLPNVKVIHGDAIQYLKTTPERFDFIHIDIWQGILTPYKQIEYVTKLAARCLRPRGTVDCWLQGNFLRMRGRLRKGAGLSTGFGVFPPCLGCGKRLRNDYEGLCMDCADTLGLSELGKVQ